MLEDAQQHFSTEQEFEEFAGKLQADLNNLINNSVSLVRSAIVRAKGAGAPCVKVRHGLRIPEDWEDNYEIVYSTNLPWIISHVMQSAFLGNPAVGETKPWMSR